MSALEASCPQCGKRLRVPDRSLLGAKARCGKCGHKFVLTLLTPEAPSRAARTPQPALQEAPIEVAELAEFRIAVRGDAPAHVAGPEKVIPKQSGPAPRPSNGAVIDVPPGDDRFPVLDLAPIVESDAERYSRRRYQRSQRDKRTTVVVAVLACFLMAGLGAYFFSTGTAPRKPAKDRRAAQESAEAEMAGEDSPPESGKRAASPTHGDPLTLQYVPMGSRIVIQLRPGDLWQRGGPGEEFRLCLGPLGIWLEEQIRAHCLLGPEQIEEVLFALIPISREAFDVALVVRSVEPIRRSELIEKINGELVDEPQPHYLTPKKVYLLHDARTFAVAPREMAASLLESSEGSGVTSQGIQALLARTDRDRHLTLLAELEDVRIGAKTLVPAEARNLLDAIVDFFGDDVETIAWSVHLGDAASGRDLFSEVVVRNRETRSPAHLREDLVRKIAQLPDAVQKIVRRTKASQPGEKKIIDRFPEMIKVVEESALVESGRRDVSAQWVLPERAAPNLALGARLTWHQTTLPGNGPSSVPAEKPADHPPVPTTIAERLQKKIDVDFRDEFLYAAVEFVGEEIGVTFKLDGPGMKRVGTTQNEKQKLALEQTPARVVLARILTPRKLVLIVDEQAKTAIVTSTEEAADKKLSPFPLEPGGGE
jgi:hypothetical protein